MFPTLNQMHPAKECNRVYLYTYVTPMFLAYPLLAKLGGVLFVST